MYGWICIISIAMVSFYYAKSIFKQTLELFDVYDFDMMYINPFLLAGCVYWSYIFSKRQIKKGYE
jgi:hypothetical protein